MRIKTNTTSLGIKAKRLFTELVQSSDWTIHPNGYSGRGRYASKTADHATTLADSLEELGLVRGRHFTTGNDAPRGGWSGEFVTLLPAGRRLKVVTDNRICVEGWREQRKTLSNNCNPRQGLLDYLADNPAEDTPSLDDLTAVEQNKLKDWYRNGCEHPCPDTVLAIKQKSRLSWRQVGDQCHAKWRPRPSILAFSPEDDTIVKVSRNTIIDNEAKHQLERVVRPNPEP